MMHTVKAIRTSRIVFALLVVVWGSGMSADGASLYLKVFGKEIPLLSHYNVNIRNIDDGKEGILRLIILRETGKLEAIVEYEKIGSELLNAVNLEKDLTKSCEDIKIYKGEDRELVLFYFVRDGYGLSVVSQSETMFAQLYGSICLIH